MPAAAAVSTMPVPFGTCTCRSSIVTVTSSGALTAHLAAVYGTGVCPNNQPESRWHLGNRSMRMLVDRREQAFERRLAAERAPALVDVRAELVAELDDVRRNGHRRGVAERAETLAEDSVTDVEQQVELRMRRVTLLNRLEQLHHPARSLTAR